MPESSERPRASTYEVSVWTGLRVHLSLWLAILLCLVVLGRGVLFPGRALLWGLLVILLVAMAVALWTPRLQRTAKLVLHTVSMGLILFVVMEYMLSDRSGKIALQRYPYPYRMHGSIPNLRGDINALDLTTNDTGMRHPEPIAPKRPGQLRIIFMGGSAVMGVGDTDDQTIAVHVERQLREVYSPDSLPGIDSIEVINAGQAWFNSTQEVIFFVTELALYEPDLVVIIDGFNDAYHSIVWGNRPPANQVTSEVMANLTNLGRIYRDLGWHDWFRTALRASRIRRRLGVPVTDLLGQPATEFVIPEIKTNRPAEENRPSMHHRLVMNWTLWARLGEALGFRTLFALQPAIYLKPILSEDEQGWLDTDPHRELVDRTWRMLDAFVTRETERLQLPYFDADRHVVASSDALFLDNCHLNGAGNERVADAVTERIAEELEEWPWTGQWDGIRYTEAEGDPIWRPLHPTVQTPWK